MFRLTRQMMPQPDDVVLHRCPHHTGKPTIAVRVENTETCCTECGAIVTADQPYRQWHAAVWCPDCDRFVGLCPGDITIDDAIEGYLNEPIDDGLPDG